MVSSFIGCGRSFADVPFNQTIYIGPIGKGTPETLLPVNNTIGDFPCKIRESGIIKNMWITVRNNSLDGAFTVNTLKDSTPTPQIISIPAAQSGVFENTTQVDFVNSGDWLYFKLVGSGTTGTVTFLAGSYEYNTYNPSETVYRNGMNWDASYPTTASSTYFSPYNGIAEPSTASAFTEADVKTRFRQSGIIRNLYVRVTANARANSSTVTMRQNGANTALTVSIGATTTGDFEDLTDNISVAADDDINFATTLGINDAVLTLKSWNTSFVTQNNIGVGMLAGGSSDDVNGDINIGGGTAYMGIVDAGIDATGTESQTQHIMRAINFTFTNLSTHIKTNNLTGSSTLTFRKNTADGNMSVSIPNATTGFFADNTAIDTTAPGDLVNYKFVFGGTGTTFIYSSITCNTLIPNLNLMTFL